MTCLRCRGRGYVRRWRRGLLFIDACPACARRAEAAWVMRKIVPQLAAE